MDTVAPIRYIKRLSSRPFSDRRNELDSHADTCIAGNNFVVLSNILPRTIVTVHGFQAGLGTKMHVASACSLYVDPVSSQKYLLILNEALIAPDLQGSLLNPNQLRFNGLTVNDIPVQFDSKSDHCIHALTEQGDSVSIPLSLEGIMSGFFSRQPTPDELREDLPHIVLTSVQPWEPDHSMFERLEDDAVRSREVSAAHSHRIGTGCHSDPNVVRLIGAVKSFRSTGFALESVLSEQGGIDVPKLVDHRVSVKGDSADIEKGDNSIAASEGDASRVSDVFAVQRVIETNELTPAVLSQRWNIGLAKAAKTLKVTTQAGVRHVYAPGERKLRQRTLHLKFPNLKGVWYSDTMFSTCKSVRSHACAQVFTNGLGYDRVYPLASKDEAHFALTMFIQEVGIPQILTMDNAPEENKGEMKKVIDAHRIQLKPTVPYAP